MSSWPVILAAIATDLVPADLALNERALMRAWCDDGDERITLAMAKDDWAVVGDEGFEFLVHGVGCDVKKGRAATCHTPQWFTGATSRLQQV